MKNYFKLKSIYKKISKFKNIEAIMHWDQATMMPSGSSEARAEDMAELSLHIHQLSKNPIIPELIDLAYNEISTSEEQSCLNEIKRSWSNSNILTDDLVQAKALAGAKCEHAWRTQREENDWISFSQNFKTVVELSQEEAQIRAEALQTTPYNAMLNLYEPGMSTNELDNIFNNIKCWLPNLINQVQQKQQNEPYIKPEGTFPIKQQKEMGLKVMKTLGFDFNSGRLDISLHPFCGGTSQDIRITTRYDENDFIQSLMGIIHETGHARYEQGLPQKYRGLPAGQARSMGIHESQSLFFEMQIGRSSEFISYLAPLAQNIFKQNKQKIFTKDNLKKIYTRVQPDYIRVDADEVTYPAHIILRYEIEKDLMNKKVSYKDIPEIWDLKMKKYLNLSTKGNYKNGCMQDIHWTDGSFGYFPSYTLGAMYAAQFMATIKNQIDVNECLSQKNLAPIFKWLSKNIWEKGSLLETNDVIMQATNESLNPQYFKEHLESRYL
ncbi:carboxypeptidase M32 [Paraphotobacterium marinum]|uniref:Metal-dependent carboxypeptidase n=1 Tax=Paraphotobacterium marinum TaxID=1755811 RepID=A0A220VGI4_9GAMM|nr:carboxypeptidase M32 [Paraphotobacterium marinum]ASK79504.1 carboxypeptidase M32 [Paraphotobacterium marinum]